MTSHAAGFAPTIESATQAWIKAVEREADRARDFGELLRNPPVVHVGETPADVVLTENKLRLLRYHPLPGRPRRYRTPVVIVYALVNRPAILDLQPDRSVVRRLLEAGHDVYLLDWGTPSDLDRHLTLDDYVNRYMYDCARRAMELSGSPEGVSVLGYCMGGAMSAMFASLHRELVRNLALMAAPLDMDTRASGLLYAWARPEHFDVDQLVDALGNVPPEFLNGGFQYLKPIENTVGKWMNLWRLAGDRPAVENFLRMEKWLNDGISVPGETYRQYIKDLYQENRLAKGEMEIGGRRVALDALQMPMVGIVGDFDHLVPPETTLRFLERAPTADKSVLRLATGHIGLSVSSKSHRDLWPRAAAWFAERSLPVESG